MANVLTTVRDWFRPKASDEPNRITTTQELDDWLRFGGQEVASGARVNVENAQGLAAVAASVRVLSNAVAQLPLQVFRRDGERREPAVDLPIYRLLHDAPNDLQTSFQWRKLMMRDLLFRGNSYNVKIPGTRGVQGLVRLHPDLTKVEQDSRGRLAYKYHRPDGTEIEYRRDQMLHIWMESDDGIVGLNPIQLYRQSIGDGISIREHGSRFFSNGAKLGVVLEQEQGTTMGEEARKALREDFEAMYAGSGNAYKTAILPGGIKTSSPVSISMEDAQWIETRKITAREIFGIFGIPPHKAADLADATFCLPGDAEVYTETGPQPIAQVGLGERVWSRCEDGRLVLSRVARIACTGEDPILTIKTEARTIRLNARHRILARRKRTCPRSGQGGYHAVAWETAYVPAGELTVGDTIVAFNGTPDSGGAKTPTRIATVPFVEFCGLYLGDGHSTPRAVTIARAAGAAYMDRYRRAMVTCFTRFDGGNGRGNLAEVQRAPVTLEEAERYTRFASVEAAKEIRDLGLGGTAHTKRVPGWVFKMSDELKLAFLRGFLDADGSVDKKGRISFSSCSRDLLSGIRHLCMSLGIPVTNLRNQRGTTTLPNGKRHPRDQWSFTCSDPGANRRIGSHTPHYVERMNTGSPFGRKGRQYPRFGGEGFCEDGAVLGRICSIDVGDSEPVYDMEVMGTHSFIADGVIVHNSNIEHENLDFVISSLQPWLVCQEQAFKRDLLNNDPNLYAKFNVSALLRGDIKARADFYTKMVSIRAMNPNEVRDKEDMNPYETGDEFFNPNIQQSGGGE